MPRHTGRMVGIAVTVLLMLYLGFGVWLRLAA